MKLNKKTVFIALAALSLLAYLFFPVLDVMGKVKLSGWNCMFGFDFMGEKSGGAGILAFLAPIVSIAAIVLAYLGSDKAKYAAWAMAIPFLWLLVQSNSSVAIGGWIYLLCCIGCSALPYIKQIPEE